MLNSEIFLVKYLDSEIFRYICTINIQTNKTINKNQLNQNNMENTETTELINVSAKMKGLAVYEKFIISQNDYKLSSVRTMANRIKHDFGLRYSVSIKEGEIIIERVK